MNKSLCFRWFYYILGLIILALGLILNTKADLGVSPIISVAYSVSVIGNFNFGNITLALYCIFVLVEIILHIPSHDKSKILRDLLQLPLSIVFTRFMNLFSDNIPVFHLEYPDSFLGSFAGQLLILLIAIILTGIGAAMTLNCCLVPNPGDGIVQAVAETIKKSVGFTKNIFDLGCIAITVILSLTLAHKLVGIGIGTILAMLLVGRMIALFNHFFKAKMYQLL